MYPGIENKSRFTKGVDKYLLMIYAALVFIGWLAIYSSTYDALAEVRTFDLTDFYGRQLLWILVSAVVGVIILLIDSNIFQTYAGIIYIVCMGLILLVVFFGADINGAKSWIRIGSFTFQPIELAKFATALMLAKFFSQGKTSLERRTQWFFAFGLILIPAAIAILQKDTGSALVFFSFIILFYREGFSTGLILLGILAIFVFVITIKFNELYAIACLTVLLIVACVFNNGNTKKIIRNFVVYGSFALFVFAVNFAYTQILQPHQRQRIDTIFGKSVDPKGADFNLNQSKIAIGSGGFFGKGYLHGTQTKLNFVPEQRTDFIFCSIGEEFGFLGSIILIGLYLTMVIRIIVLSEKARTDFTRIYGYGVASIIFFHLFINIGMTIGLIPVIGIPLPLVSYGGSSMLGFTLLIFTFLKLSAEY